MTRPSESGRLPHCYREVSTQRPMHLTVRVRAGAPSLRSGKARAIFVDLVRAARQRGLRTVAFAIMTNHVHWVGIPDSKTALGDATRYVFGQLARRLNRLWGRSGPLFEDRYHSVIGRSVRHAWNMINYVLANPFVAACEGARRRVDPYLGVDRGLLVGHPFLGSIFGPPGEPLDGLVKRMTRKMLPFVPLRERLQPMLPGL